MVPAGLAVRGAAPTLMRIATSVGLVWAGLLVAGGMVTNVGMVAGVAGVISALPGLSLLVAAFGLTQLVWFVGIGVVVLRAESRL